MKSSYDDGCSTFSDAVAAVTTQFRLLGLKAKRGPKLADC